MGEHSGYDQVYREIENHWPHRCISLFRRAKPLTPSFRRKFYHGLHKWINPNPFYNINSLEVEVAAFKKALRHLADLVHISYTENNYGFLSRVKAFLPAKLVATVHQPPGWWEENHWQRHILAKLDAIIILNSKVKPYFEEYLPGRVFLVPHGIDTDFFSPGPGVEEKFGQNPRLVFSGHWLRDIKTLYEVIEGLGKEMPSVQFDLIVPKNKRYDEDFKKIARFANVEWHAGISDEALREVYRRGSLLFLPLLDCTANNAVLEAMACGLPVVSSRVGGIPDYTHESFASLLEPGDVPGFKRTLMELLTHKKQLAEKSRLARQYAEKNLKWEIIAQRTLDVYRSIQKKNKHL